MNTFHILLKNKVTKNVEIFRENVADVADDLFYAQMEAERYDPNAQIYVLNANDYSASKAKRMLENGQLL